MSVAASGEHAVVSPKEGDKVTYAHEDQLPPLPLPPLEETLERYLKSCAPLVSEEEYEHTEAICHDFKNGIGKTLHDILQSRAEEERNWLEDWWETIIYLRPRYPTAVNINWHGVLPGKWGPQDLSQAQAAAMLSYGILEFREKLVKETLPVETLAGQPLCMRQYSRMFNSCVIPGEECDSMEVYEHIHKHIVVLRNNSIFVFDVLDDNGNILPLSILDRQFQAVIKEGTTMFELERNPPVSVLSSENRTNWAKAREYIIQLGGNNEENFQIIQTALFAVALDSTSPATEEDIARQCLLGDGRNRWFDKTFNMVVFENAKCGVNGQHAFADALVLVRLFDYLVKRVSETFEQRRPLLEDKDALSSRNIVPARRLEWTLDPAAISTIESASGAISKLIYASQLKHLRFIHYGKGFMKRYRLIPDFYVQLALQLAYYKIYNEPTAVYESGHTRLFYGGRTSTIRACTSESLDFCKAMVNSGSSDGEKWDKLQIAIKKHKEIAKEAMTGRDVDRPLFGLQVVAEMSGIKPKPSLFTDPAFTRTRRFKLSTSNISGGGDASALWGGFSAMYDDGYGVCYGISEDVINFSITCYHHCPHTDTEKFARSLESALLDMRELCLARNVIYIGGTQKGKL